MDVCKNEASTWLVLGGCLPVSSKMAAFVVPLLRSKGVDELKRSWYRGRVVEGVPLTTDRGGWCLIPLVFWGVAILAGSNFPG